MLISYIIYKIVSKYHKRTAQEARNPQKPNRKFNTAQLLADVQDRPRPTKNERERMKTAGPNSPVPTSTVSNQLTAIRCRPFSPVLVRSSPFCLNPISVSLCGNRALVFLFFFWTVARAYFKNKNVLAAEIITNALPHIANYI